MNPSMARVGWAENGTSHNSTAMSDYKRVILLRRLPTLVSTLLVVARVTKGIDDESTDLSILTDIAIETWKEQGEKLIILEASSAVIAEMTVKCKDMGILHYAEDEDALAIGPCPSATFTRLGTDALLLYPDQPL